MREITKSETVERAEEYATPLNKLIRPSDVKEGAEGWGAIDHETVEREAVESARIMLAEKNYHTPLQDVLHRRSITLLKEDMPRAPLEHLSFDKEQEAVAHGYWPYKTTHGEVFVFLQETYPVLGKIPPTVYRDAYEEVHEGLVQGMIPTEVSDQ